MAASRDAIQLFRTGPDAQRKAYVEYAAALGLSGAGPIQSNNPLVQSHIKSVGALAAGDVVDEVGDLPGAFLASIAEGSLLDQLAQYATPLAQSGRSFMVAASESGSLTVEGRAKVLRKPGLSVGGREPYKATSTIVLTNEVERLGAERFMALLDAELAGAVTRAANSAVLAALDPGSVLALAGTGDYLGDLRAALAVAQPSRGYVIAASTAATLDLATRGEVRGNLGVRGGEFAPGIHVVPADSISSGLYVIPASHVALWLGSLELARANHATVDIADSPTSDSTAPTGTSQVSLWQAGSFALRAERMFHLAGVAEVVSVGVGS